MDIDKILAQLRAEREEMQERSSRLRGLVGSGEAARRNG
jgi:hypothetical protein